MRLTLKETTNEGKTTITYIVEENFPELIV